MSHIQNKFDKIKENLNFISIGLMILVQILLSLFSIENGEIAFNAPKTLIAWCLWAVQIILVTTIAVVILSFFRREGIRRGHKKIEETYNNYLMALNKNAKERNPRSLKEYMVKEGAKDTASKIIVYVIVTLITGSLLISPNFNNIISLIANILLSIGFGIKTMLSAENFVTEELCVWYKKRILEIEEEKEHDKSRLIKRGKCRIGHAFTSRVQQKKECGAGQQNSESNITG